MVNEDNQKPLNHKTSAAPRFLTYLLLLDQAPESGWVDVPTSLRGIRCKTANRASNWLRTVQ